jgi:hypothetical protein
MFNLRVYYLIIGISMELVEPYFHILFIPTIGIRVLESRL